MIIYVFIKIFEKKLINGNFKELIFEIIYIG